MRRAAVRGLLAGCLVGAAANSHAAGPADVAGSGAASDGGAPAAAALTDHREIIVPASAVELLRIDNPLGRVEIRGGSRTGEIHIVADKRAASGEALSKLRVHYTAFGSGEVRVDTRVELGGRERSLPLSGSRVDLVLEVPPDVAVEAKTFGGDVSASGLRAGARLETTGGRIGVSDVRGGVVTRQLRGGQRVSAVEGDLDLDGVEGEMELRGVGGGRLDARVVDGNIHAEDVRSAWVRLTTTTGQIVLIGMLRPGARYDLRSYAGDVRVVPVGDAVPFELRARSALPVQSAVALRGVRRQGDWLRARYPAGPARTPRATVVAGAVLEMSSSLGRVIIQPRQSPSPTTDATDIQ